jgi:hypothetical protein
MHVIVIVIVRIRVKERVKEKRHPDKLNAFRICSLILPFQKPAFEASKQFSVACGVP